MSEVNLGQLITTPQNRDAIHIAVAPVIAAESMEPGQHIQLNHDGKACSGKEPIGIVDPYLKQDVMPGERFWLWLYPKTVTNLRHDWSHPAFEKKEETDKVAAKAWLRNAASQLDVTYKVMIEAAAEYQKTGEMLGIGFDTPDMFCSPEEMETFWTHYETVTGLKVKDKSEGFVSCSC